MYGDEFFEVSYPIDHFLHLTGVETGLSAKGFYKNAKKRKLANSQFFLTEGTHMLMQRRNCLV